MDRLSVLVHRFRKPLLGVLSLTFLAYLLGAGRPPGASITIKDTLFLLALFGAPFGVFAYSLWSLTGCSELSVVSETIDLRRRKIALWGTMLSVASAALLLLLLPFWSTLVEHTHFGTIWVILGMVFAAAATMCGIIGSSKLRRAAVSSALLLPFWIFAAGLLVKASMD